VLRCVAAVLDLNALRNKALAAFLAAAAKDVAAGFGGHTGPEAELVFPCALGWLISTFAHGVASINVLWTETGMRLGARTLWVGNGLSIHQWQEIEKISTFFAIPAFSEFPVQ
jgi:hypothetical protein